jgi:hypothetical protein
MRSDVSVISCLPICKSGSTTDRALNASEIADLLGQKFALPKQETEQWDGDHVRAARKKSLLLA